MNRRALLKTLALAFCSTNALASISRLSSSEYVDITYPQVSWTSIGEGLSYSQTPIHRRDNLVDIVSAVKINPNRNKIKVFSAYNESSKKCDSISIENWQKQTGATVLVNSAQYQGDPYWGRPCALLISDGIQKGPKINVKASGMLVSEPTKSGLPLSDLLDFDYDPKFDWRNPSYKEGVQHWPILLDRQGRIKVANTSWQANRTVFAKDFEGNIVLFTTEGGFFTLYHFGRFLKENRSLGRNGFNIHTAMNSDGGYEAEMCIRTRDFNYTTYGQFETYGPKRDASIPNAHCLLPGVIGVFPRINASQE